MARTFVLFSLVLALLPGCILDRSALGVCGPGLCGDADPPPDAWMGDGAVIPDAGRDAFVADAGDAMTPDAFMDMPDGFVMPPDDGGMDGGSDGGSDAGSDAGRDGGSDGGSDAGMDAGSATPALVIRFAHTPPTTTVRGFIFRVAWNTPPPGGAMSSIWYTVPCDSSHAMETGSAVVCGVSLADAPELMADRTVDLYPVSGSGASLCSSSSCPGAITDWSFTFGATSVAASEISLQTGAAVPGPTIPGDPAYIRIAHLPTP